MQKACMGIFDWLRGSNPKKVSDSLLKEAEKWANVGNEEYTEHYLNKAKKYAEKAGIDISQSIQGILRLLKKRKS